MKVKLVSLERWAELRYEVPPPIGTLRKWARNGNIYPVPEKEGTQYRVRPDAVFIRPNKYCKTINTNQSRHPLKGRLVERIIDGEAGQV
ncbi:excisionase [Citrobacter freundii]|uniref:excisionase n=1 Tax=Citrobacter freundii TaxID=546 RepID=UPI0019090413|nr:excisionase [Citrobacter freundii]MBJ9086062.1 excisionase [Citrobacter freundii]MDT7333390.1 excisionase [Citrobacter freundii]